jgi:ribosomal-protein-alanine N-acetyltransferase
MTLRRRAGLLHVALAVPKSGMARVRYFLRLATPSDAPVIALMSRDLVETGLGWEYRPARIAALIDDPDTLSVVACEADRLLGFAILAVGDERAHLVLLAVRPQHQRRGIGRELVAWLLESCKVAGVASVHVELRARNSAAVALYASSGFAETLRVPGYYRGREAAIRMVRILRVPGRLPEGWRPPTSNKRN